MSAKSSVAWPRPLIGFDTPDLGPPLLNAAGLLTGVLRLTGLDTFQELQEAYARLCRGDDGGYNWKRIGRLHLTDEQIELLTEFGPVLRLMSISPPVSLAVCPDCYRPTGPAAGQVHGWQVVSRAAPSKCRVTAGCGGKPVRAKAAARVPYLLNEDDTVTPAPAPSEEEVSVQ